MKKLGAVLGVSVVILLALLGRMLYEVNRPAEELPPSVAVIEVTPIASPSPKAEPTKTVVDEPDEIRTDMRRDDGTVVEASEKQWDVDVEEDIRKQEELSGDDIVTHSYLSYAYGELGDTDRELYDVIYKAIVCYKEEVPVPTTDPNNLDRVFNCVMMDHPEIFYINGYRYTKYTVGDTIRRILFSPSYTYSRQETEELIPVLHDAVQDIIGRVYADSTDYAKIKYIYDTIVLNTEYDVESPDNQNVLSVLLYHRSVCQGYAKTMQLILNGMDIPCTLVTGVVQGGERHAWNLVLADGDWYYVDVTWGDVAYKFVSKAGEDEVASAINYDYLLVPYGEIAQTHVIEEIVKLPECTCLNDNYYVKEGLYFLSYDTDQLHAAFDNAFYNGENTVVIKCCDEVLYAKMYSELIDNQKIFEFAHDKQDMAYSYNQSMNKLVFAIRR